MPYRIATGFDFGLLSDGNVRVEFCDDGGETINTQVIAGDVFARIPLVAFIALVAMDQGAEVAEKLVRIMRTAEEVEYGCHE